MLNNHIDSATSSILQDQIAIAKNYNFGIAPMQRSNSTFIFLYFGFPVICNRLHSHFVCSSDNQLLYFVILLVKMSILVFIIVEGTCIFLHNAYNTCLYIVEDVAFLLINYKYLTIGNVTDVSCSFLF